MATISKTGIQDGLTSKAEHITRIIDALDGTATTDVVATGSFTGSFTGDGSNITGVTAEWDGTHVGNASITGSLTVTNTVSGSFVGEGNLTGSFTGSFDGIHTGTINSASYSDTAVSSSYAVTASYAENAGGGASKLHLPFMDPAGGGYVSGRTLLMGNGSANRLAGTPNPTNVENYFQVPITGTVVSASIAFQANGGSVSDGNVTVSLFNLDTNVSESLFNSIVLFAATTSSIIDCNLTVNAGDRIAMIVDIGTLAGSVGADGRINGTALLVES